MVALELLSGKGEALALQAERQAAAAKAAAEAHRREVAQVQVAEFQARRAAVQDEEARLAAAAQADGAQQVSYTSADRRLPHAHCIEQWPLQKTLWS